MSVYLSVFWSVSSRYIYLSVSLCECICITDQLSVLLSVCPLFPFDSLSLASFFGLSMSRNVSPNIIIKKALFLSACLFHRLIVLPAVCRTICLPVCLLQTANSCPPVGPFVWLFLNSNPRLTVSCSAFLSVLCLLLRQPNPYNYLLLIMAC